MPIQLLYETRVDNKKAKQDLNKFGTYAQSFGKQIGVKFFGAAAILGATIAGVRSMMQEAETTLKLASQLGLTVEQTRALEAAAENANVSVQDMAAALKRGGDDAIRLQEALKNLDAPKTGLSGEELGHLGVSVRGFKTIGIEIMDFFGTLGAALGKLSLAVRAIWSGLRIRSWRDVFKGSTWSDETFDRVLDIFNEPQLQDLGRRQLRRVGERAAERERAKRIRDKLGERISIKGSGQVNPSAPSFSAGSLAGIGGFNALSGIAAANYQRELLDYTRQIADSTRRTAEMTRGDLLATAFSALPF